MLLGRRPGDTCLFAYGAITLFGATFQKSSAKAVFCNSLRELGFPRADPTTPRGQRSQALTPVRFGLIPFRSPLLRESRLLSFLPATKMIQFAGLPPCRLWINLPVTLNDERRVAPFGNPRIKGCLHLPGALSLLATPFIGPQCLGIHRMPFVALPYR